MAALRSRSPPTGSCSDRRATTSSIVNSTRPGLGSAMSTTASCFRSTGCRVSPIRRHSHPYGTTPSCSSSAFARSGPMCWRRSLRRTKFRRVHDNDCDESRGPKTQRPFKRLRERKPMSQVPVHASCRAGVTAMIAAAVIFAATSIAQAQVALLVDGQPITALDIEQRTKFIEMSTHKTPTRQEVIDGLIDELLEIREAKRYTIDPSDSDVNDAFNNIASNMGVDAQKLSQILANGGASAATLKQRLRAVAVRDPVIKSSADIPEALRGILDNTEVGHLTPPEQTDEGIQMFAVCSKKESKNDSPAMQKMRDQLFEQKFGAQAKRYLANLRRAAMIEYKQPPDNGGSKTSRR